ncbi:hypothetical protein [Paraburkholderia sp. J8-2]|uniref:hypothetical protein n=1 Tax=Paraburkholderia sp. J8-2 TaxID=2805440 RepID=UPI002AB7D718|nr:hypothetical protein [Paraburkholderia sp. J8-2]
MRTYFRSTKRVKQIAKALSAAIPSYSLCRALDAVAMMFGYRDWHDLDTFTANYRGEPTPPMGDLGSRDPLDRSRHDEEQFQIESLAKALGPHGSHAEDVYWWITGGFEGISRRRLSDEPEGRQILRCMAYDRFPRNAAKFYAWADFDYGDDGNFVCGIVPDLECHYGGAANAFLKWVDRHEDKLTAMTIAEATRTEIRDETVSTKLDDGSMQQGRLVRIVAFEAGTDVIQGIATVELVMRVLPVAGIEVDVIVHAAQTRSDEDFCEVALATTLLIYLEHVVDFTLWSNIDHEDLMIEFDAIPMSRGAGDMVDCIMDLLQDKINQGEFAMDCAGLIQSEFEVIEFDNRYPESLDAVPG